MIRRQIAVGAVVVTLVASLAACGKKDAGQARNLKAPGGDPRLSLTLAHGPLRAHQSVHWNLIFANVSHENVQLTFKTSQRAEIVLLGKKHKVVYQWSKARRFAQMVATTTVGPGRKLAIPLDGTLDVAAGRYQLRAGMASTPAPTPIYLEVTVES
jgi:uncharacterized lipoprotein YehR (DUF1307 family)